MKTDGNGFSRLSHCAQPRMGTKALQVGVYAQHRSDQFSMQYLFGGGGIPLNETTRRNFRGTRRTRRIFRALTDFPVLPVVLKAIFTSLQCVPSSVMLLRNVSAASKVDTTVTRPMTTT